MALAVALAIVALTAVALAVVTLSVAMLPVVEAGRRGGWSSSFWPCLAFAALTVVASIRHGAGRRGAGTGRRSSGAGRRGQQKVQAGSFPRLVNPLAREESGRPARGGGRTSARGLIGIKFSGPDGPKANEPKGYAMSTSPSPPCRLTNCCEIETFPLCMAIGITGHKAQGMMIAKDEPFEKAML